MGELSRSARRRAAEAGHRGKADEARRLLADADAEVRVLALTALDRSGALTVDDLARHLVDPDMGVRRRAARLSASRPAVDLVPTLADPAPEVVEMAAWAAGERPYQPPTHEQLRRIAADHPDTLCREAAVAALGAIGHADGLPAILAALDDRATVRRRAVVALAPFDGPDVEAALRRALDDRDWQVRQIAEDLVSPPD